MRARITHTRQPRAIAMLLVLISLMLATILTSAYLASRDNSGTIADNVASAAAARWSAEAGLELALALLQTETNWRGQSDGVIVEDYSIGGGTVRIVARDLETNLAPNPATQYVEVTCFGSVHGVMQSCGAIAYVPIAALDGADVDLSEFAIFANGNIELSGEALVSRWPRAPLSKLGEPVQLAIGTNSAFGIALEDDAAVIDGHVFTPPDPSSNILTSSTGELLPIEILPDAIPFPAAPGSDVAAPQLDLLGFLTTTVRSVIDSPLITATERWASISILNNARPTLRGTIDYIADTDLEIIGAKLRIDGNVKIVVFEDVKLDNAAIELMPGATLAIYVGGNLDLSNSYIGDVRPNSQIDSSGHMKAIDPERVRILRLPQINEVADWTLSGLSAVKGSIYAPRTRFRIKDESALYGRVAAQEVRITDSSALFYDPALNTKNGYSTADSPVYGSDGHIKNGFADLVSLDPTALQQIADATDTTVLLPDGNVVLHPSAHEAPTPAESGVDQPTPRPVPIIHWPTHFGAAPSEWE